MNTQPRPKEHDELSAHEAAFRVMDYIGEQEHGPWKIEHFEVDESRAQFEQLKSQFGESPDRAVPAGTYLGLTYTEDGYEPTDEQIEKGFTMMSNTPDEITDHDLAFEKAEGDVLVSGLGIGCVVAGLLTNPKVRHIDVVEKDPDIIAITGPAFTEDPRVTIHRGDAATIEWPEGKHWNYAWHDIWAKISANNLEVGEAEHGISYFTLFDRYRKMVDDQDAWVFAFALVMEEAHRIATQKMLDMAIEWRDGTTSSRIDQIIYFHANGQRMKTPVEAIRALFENDPDLWEQTVKKAEDSKQAFFMLEAHTFYDEAKELVSEQDVREYISGEREFELFDTAAIIDQIKAMGDDADGKH